MLLLCTTLLEASKSKLCPSEKISNISVTLQEYEYLLTPDEVNCNVSKTLETFPSWTQRILGIFKQYSA